MSDFSFIMQTITVKISTPIHMRMEGIDVHVFDTIHSTADRELLLVVDLDRFVTHHLIDYAMLVLEKGDADMVAALEERAELYCVHPETVLPGIRSMAATIRKLSGYKRRDPKWTIQRFVGYNSIHYFKAPFKEVLRKRRAAPLIPTHKERARKVTKFATKNQCLVPFDEGEISPIGTIGIGTLRDCVLPLVLRHLLKSGNTTAFGLASVCKLWRFILLQRPNYRAWYGSKIDHPLMWQETAISGNYGCGKCGRTVSMQHGPPEKLNLQIHPSLGPLLRPLHDKCSEISPGCAHIKNRVTFAPRNTMLMRIDALSKDATNVSNQGFWATLGDLAKIIVPLKGDCLDMPLPNTGPFFVVVEEDAD